MACGGGGPKTPVPGPSNVSFGGATDVLAADPKEHQHSVDGKKGRYLFVASMFKSTMTQQQVEQVMITAMQRSTGMTTHFGAMV
jgi:hypothetical protein